MLRNLFPHPIWLPFSWLFRLGVAFKNFLYDHKLFPLYRPPVPVISVGGLEAGGSGKTPVLLTLVRYFLNRGTSVAVISRGYRRTTSGIRCLKEKTDWRECGDEAYLVWKKTRVPVVVGKKWKAARWAVENLKPDLLLVDDGFQHRKLARTVDILVSSDWETLKAERLLPAGPLREPLKSLRRSHLLLFRQHKNPKLPFDRPAVPFSYELTRARLWPEKRELELPALKQKKLFLFAGLGQPENFLESAKRWQLSIAGSYGLPDHHPYTQAEVDWLVEKSKASGADFLATTEKDAVRLAGLSFPGFSLVVLEIECKIEGEEYFFRKLEDRLFGRTFV
ncbi:MAG: tetraacyldisaccharide 4'-kinase [candidate division Zixibacteria bacterium]|nr:tetraacyldisaccharide 4'-kinase [candidate division Zixibacteria bacterium]